MNEDYLLVPCASRLRENLTPTLNLATPTEVISLLPPASFTCPPTPKETHLQWSLGPAFYCGKQKAHMKIKTLIYLFILIMKDHRLCDLTLAGFLASATL